MIKQRQIRWHGQHVGRYYIFFSRLKQLIKTIHIDLSHPLLDYIRSVPIDRNVVCQLHRNQHTRERSGDGCLSHDLACLAAYTYHISRLISRKVMLGISSMNPHFCIHFGWSAACVCSCCHRPRDLRPPDDGAGSPPSYTELGRAGNVVGASAECVNDALTIFARDMLVTVSRRHSRGIMSV